MYLVIGKDREEVRRALAEAMRGLEASPTLFYPENFTLDAFFQEVETRPFLSKKKSVVVHGVDQLAEGAQEGLRKYLEKASPWVDLYLTAEALTAASKIVKLVEKQGNVVRLKEEKPWEKEKRLITWLVQEAKREGVELQSAAAAALVQGTDHQMLAQELEKLICFAGERKVISVEDVSLLCNRVHHETLWQLGDAVFAGEGGKALAIGSQLLDDGTAIFPLLAGLRSQCVQGLGILEAHAQGDVAQKYPYLKGALLDKKIRTLKQYGSHRLKEAMLAIFETEVKAKNSSIEPSLLLELLTVRLTCDPLSAT